MFVDLLLGSVAAQVVADPGAVVHGIHRYERALSVTCQGPMTPRPGFKMGECGYWDEVRHVGIPKWLSCLFGAEEEE